jgi:hypothetical protein
VFPRPEVSRQEIRRQFAEELWVALLNGLLSRKICKQESSIMTESYGKYPQQYVTESSSRENSIDTIPSIISGDEHCGRKSFYIREIKGTQEKELVNQPLFPSPYNCLW